MPSAFTPGRAGRDLYEQARKQAGARRPADPQRTTGGPAFPELNTLCATPVPGGVCGHANCLHVLGERNHRPAVTACTIMTAAGRCGCRIFTPGDNPVETTEGDRDD